MSSESLLSLGPGLRDGDMSSLVAGGRGGGGGGGGGEMGEASREDREQGEQEESTGQGGWTNGRHVENEDTGCVVRVGLGSVWTLVLWYRGSNSSLLLSILPFSLLLL